jgi:hypothetical protein
LAAAGARPAGGNSAVNDFLHSSSGSPASRETAAGNRADNISQRTGILAGTYQNKTTDKTESLEGMVDLESQRAAWTIAGKNTPILETGISNLTQNEASVLVHFEDGKTQQWLMVRIDNPDAKAETK